MMYFENRVFITGIDEDMPCLLELLLVLETTIEKEVGIEVSFVEFNLQGEPLEIVSIEYGYEMDNTSYFLREEVLRKLFQVIDTGSFDPKKIWTTIQTQVA